MKEVAKFFSGTAASQTVSHGAKAISGTRFSVSAIDAPLN